MNIPDILYFPFFGPNRRSDLRVVEARLNFTAPGKPLPRGAAVLGRVADLLRRNGILGETDAFPQPDPGDRDDAAFAAALAHCCLLFQQKAGHRVSFQQTRPRRHAEGQWLALVEHEHCDVGMTAMKLAVALLRGERSELREPFERFLEFARQRLLPLETAALIRAAEQRGIPWLNLDRAPFTQPARRADPVRPNGLLQLGHGRRARVLDGSLCMSTATGEILSLRSNREKRRAVLAGLGLHPMAADSARAADRTVRILAVNGQAHAPQPTTKEWVALALGLHRELRGQAVELELVTAKEAGQAGPEAVVDADFCLGPDLAGAAGADVAMLDALAGGLVDGLFGAGENGAIPIVAVTGTNGKTTTSRMIARLFKEAGFRTGLVCTDGVYLDETPLASGDRGSMTGHASLLTHRGLEAAVLETHHRGIAVRGFAFTGCDVGVVLNVTHEHLQRGEIETVEEMAEIKRAVAERAAGAAVLFADDAHCAAMPDHLRADTLWLVSLHKSVSDLAQMAAGRAGGCCVLERDRAAETLVLYDGARRIPLIAAADIPATRGGTARFNVSNAMHAAVAAYTGGVAVEAIRSALGRFGAKREDTPGRLNVYDRFSFRIVADFAHTPDGLRKICEFADRQAPGGRKVLAFASTPSRGADVARMMGRTAAGHFDFYFCKDYSVRPGQAFTPMASVLRDGLLERGIPEQAVRLTTDGREAAFEVFSFCRPGDLLIYLVGHLEYPQMEDFIEAYAATLPADHPALGAQAPRP